MYRKILIALTLLFIPPLTLAQNSDEISRVNALQRLIELKEAGSLSPEQEERLEQAQRDSFQLWNRCEPVTLDLTYQTEELVVTTRNLSDLEYANAVATMLESRLRAARIYSDNNEIPQFATLFVHIQVVGNAFAVRMELRKFVTDIRSNMQYRAGTWSTSGVGVASDHTHVLSIVSKNIGEFVDEYLRVNGPSCP